MTTSDIKLNAIIGATRAILHKDTFADSARAIFDYCKEVTGATSGYVALLCEDGQENEVLFGVEVVRQYCLAHAGLVRHVLQGEVVQALLAHHLVGAPDLVRLLRRQSLAVALGTPDQAVRLRQASTPLTYRAVLGEPEGFPRAHLQTNPDILHQGNKVLQLTY